MTGVQTCALPIYTNSQYNLPEIGKKLAYKANREGVEEHFPDPSVRKTLAVDVSLIAHYDPLLGEVALSSTRTATAPSNDASGPATCAPV